MAKKKKETLKVEKVLPTPEFLSKYEVVEEETQRAGQKRMRVVNQRWIDIYYRKNVISRNNYHYAERLHHIWEGTGLRMSVTTQLKPIIGGTDNKDISDFAAACFADYNKIARLMGNITFDIIRSVVIENNSASDWARKTRRSKKAAPELLRIALDELEDVFKNLNSKDNK